MNFSICGQCINTFPVTLGEEGKRDSCSLVRQISNHRLNTSSVSVAVSGGVKVESGGVRVESGGVRIDPVNASSRTALH